MTFDEDALIAAVDLVGRSGGKKFEVGYLDEDVPSDRARWYASAQYRGARLIAENHRDPVQAAEALARRILDGGMCTHCKKTVFLSGPQGRKRCRWTRNGKKWVRGCTSDKG